MPNLMSFFPQFSARTQRPGYTIVFQMKELDLSSRVESVKIINTINSVYPVVIIKFNLDSKDISMEQLYGQDDLLLGISYTDPENSTLEEYNIDLSIVQIVSPLGLKKDDTKPDYQSSQPVDLICLATKALDAMGSPVDKIVEFGDEKIPLDIAKEIFQDFAKDASSNIVEDNKNDEKIFQCNIPQDISLVKSIKFLDNNYGIFKGPMFFYCNIEEGDAKINLWDLGKKINTKEDYKIYFVALEQDDTNRYSETADNIYYTKEPINLISKGSSNTLSTCMKHIVIDKPLDTLFRQKNYKLDDVFKNLGIAGGENKELFYNKLADKRIKYHGRNITGSSGGDSYITSALSDWISKCTQISFKLSGSFFISYLTKIGGCVKLIPQVEEYKKFEGNYISIASVINIFRNNSGNFTSNVIVKCFRGNIEN